MKFFRNFFVFVLIFSTLAISPCTVIKAEAGVIHQTSSTETVTSGATLEKIARFTTEGWLNINVLRVDLSNPNIKVDALADSSSIKNLSTTKALTQSKGAIAAINGGFFNWMKESGTAYADGPVVQSGKMLSADNEYNRYSDSMGTFSINNFNQALFNYWKTDITLKAPNGATIVVMQYNKPSKQNYTDFTVLDKRWSDNTIGAIYPDITEVIVDSGKVVEIRQAQPAVKIPDNGYVIVTRQSGAQFINSNIKVGDNIGLSISTTPDWNNLKMAMTGSAILIKDGLIPLKFSYNIAGRHPRTAVGSSRDGKQLLLVTVDGRQNNSIGMTQTELAQLMLELGAYNALNLDGGGSTTMVARTPGTNNLEVINSPSDGMQRSVSTAIGVFSLAPPSTLDGLLIDTSDKNVFVNTSREFTIKGYDRYFNPISVNIGEVKWSVSGVQGYFKDNIFFPQSTGEGKIKATIGSVSTELPVNVLSAPVQLELNNKTIKLSTNQTKALSLSGKDKNGYRASISATDASWSVNGGIGNINSGIFTALSRGTGYIDVSVGDTHSYCAVSVSSDSFSLKDDFEQNNSSFTAWPTTVKGNYELSTEQKRSGKYSGKLTYDFTSTEGTRAAYMVLPDGGLHLEKNTNKLGIWAYNTGINSNWLRAEIIDANGKKHTVEFTRNMDWNGWKYIEASLDGISSPSSLSRIYLVQVSPVSVTGSIYLDDLSVSTNGGFPEIDMNQIPKDSVPVDEAEKSVEYQGGSNSFRFSVFGNSRPSRNMLERVLLARLTENINTNLDAASFVGQYALAAAKDVKKSSLATNAGYKSFDIKGSRFIQLDMGTGSLRIGNPEQWSWFLQQLDSARGNNIFIFLSGSPLSFKDNLEAGLFQDILTKNKQKTGKNLWVFYKSEKNNSYMENGVKYITSAGFDIDGISGENIELAKYILVTVMGDNVTFEFKPIIE